jgi:hypothetical protein
MQIKNEQNISYDYVFIISLSAMIAKVILVVVVYVVVVVVQIL